MLFSFLVGFSIFALSAFIVVSLFKALTITLPVQHEVIVTKFGRFNQSLTESGLHFLPEKILPWVKCFSVSKQRDFVEFSNLQIHDKTGTLVLVDLWLEYRIQDARRSLFAVEHWENSLKSGVMHAVMSILSRMDCEQIFLNRTHLEQNLKQEIARETESWGIFIEGALIKNIGLQPDVSKQILDTVAAKLEHTKAMIEEGARLTALRLESQTHLKIAELQALAKGQYPLAVGRAYEALKTDVIVFKAYEELFQLSKLQPHKTIAFEGFHLDSLKSIDAAMTATPFLEKLEPTIHWQSPVLGNEQEERRGS